MRATGVRRIVFSSTGSVYGEPEVFPTPEDAPFPVQTSLYGASKLAGEGLIAGLLRGLRLHRGRSSASSRVLGERYTHGHVFDFYRALRRDPTRLRVLGDGRQRKSYLYVAATASTAMLTAGRGARGPARRRGLQPRAPTRSIVVDDSVAAICAHLGVDARASSTPAASAAGSATAR